ncbi:putative hect E3 ubiquitin ligase, partial [Operophtera brumata]
SSLHYAACFGRPAIAKVLLRFGANADLRDEDGKTPLDKARERHDQGHREVAAILQCPGEWLVVGNNDSLASGNEDDFPETGDKEMAAMVHYAPARLLREMSCAREPHTAALLTQLVAAVLDNVLRKYLKLELLFVQHKTQRVAVSTGYIRK